MQFGIFYEHQLPRPWAEDSEHRLLKEALEQVELADRLGIDYAWEVEHHFLEEYSHSSAPEVFLAACSQRTRRIRLGHGIVLMPSGFNHPARVAERIATLDLISDGRVEWGTGSSSSRSELEGFGIDPEQKHVMWEESVREAARMMVMEPYAGFEGRSFTMPARNVVPPPLQRDRMDDFLSQGLSATYHGLCNQGARGTIADWITRLDNPRGDGLNLLAAALAFERQRVRQEGYIWLMEVGAGLQEKIDDDGADDPLRHLALHEMAYADGIQQLQWLQSVANAKLAMYRLGLKMENIAPAQRDLPPTVAPRHRARARRTAKQRLNPMERS